MANDGPLKVMYLNPVGTPDYDEVFADMARNVKLPDTEVHLTSLKPADGAFTHISTGPTKRWCRPASSGRRARRQREGSTRWPSAASWPAASAAVPGPRGRTLPAPCWSRPRESRAPRVATARRSHARYFPIAPIPPLP